MHKNVELVNIYVIHGLAKHVAIAYNIYKIFEQVLKIDLAFSVRAKYMKYSQYA